MCFQDRISKGVGKEKGKSKERKREMCKETKGGREWERRMKKKKKDR